MKASEVQSGGIFWPELTLGAGELSVAALIDVCLSENDRRLAGYDPRLLRPNTVPRLMRFARRFMRRPGRDAAPS